VTFSAPLYGADLLKTLMDSSSKAWDLNNLDSLLSDAMETNVRGVNTPYCYVGSWKAFFCWHTEDLDLSGINFIHEGKSKFWYAINYQDKKIIEREAIRLFT
jgi:jumonji domain-containing protein 2